MKLFYYGSKVLQDTICEPVKSFDSVSDLKVEMIGMMSRQRWNGLSAPQIGSLLRYVIIRKDDGSFLELANPEITQMYGFEVEECETCVSVPPVGNCCKVPRIQIIHVSHGAGDVVFNDRFKGRESRLIQHQVDHLVGTFFFHRAESRERDSVLRRYDEWQRQRKINQEKSMALVRAKKAVPDDTPLEAGNVMCRACGRILEPEAVKGPNRVETVKYVHPLNEETGCNYTIERAVPVQHVEMKGIRS